MGAVAQTPPSQPLASMEESGMNAFWVGDRGSPEVVDLQARRAGKVAGSVAVHLDRSGRWTIVTVEGEMDLRVRQLVPDLVAGDATSVVFELRGVTFLDAGGLGLMIDTQRQALGAGGCVRLVAPSARAWRLLTLTGADRLLPVFGSVGAAVSEPVATSPGSIC